MRDMARDHSDLLTMVTISDSYEGRDINAFKAS